MALKSNLHEPLREGDGWEIADWEIRQWRYVPTVAYGGPKVDNVALQSALQLLFQMTGRKFRFNLKG